MKIHNMWWAPFLQVPMWFLIATKGNWTPHFPRAWRGRRVVISLNGECKKDKMAAIKHNRFELKSSPYADSMMVFYFKDEGLTWCFGWFGKRVDALRVATALESAA